MGCSSSKNVERERRSELEHDLLDSMPGSVVPPAARPKAATLQVNGSTNSPPREIRYVTSDVGAKPAAAQSTNNQKKGIKRALTFESTSASTASPAEGSDHDLDEDDEEAVLLELERAQEASNRRRKEAKAAKAAKDKGRVTTTTPDAAVFGARYNACKGVITVAPGAEIPVAVPGTRRLFLKVGCPACMPLLAFLAEAGLRDQFTPIHGDCVEGPVKDYIEGVTGKLSYPALELGKGEIMLDTRPGSCDIMAKIAAENKVNLSHMWVFKYMADGVVPSFMALFKYLCEKQGGMAEAMAWWLGHTKVAHIPCPDHPNMLKGFGESLAFGGADCAPPDDTSPDEGRGSCAAGSCVDASLGANMYGPRYDPSIGIIEVHPSKGIPAARPGTRRLFVKVGCPFCIEPLMFVAEAGLRHVVTPIYGEPGDVVEDYIKELSGLTGCAAFPCLELEDGTVLLTAQAIIARLAVDNRVDMDHMWCTKFASDGIMPSFMALFGFLVQGEGGIEGAVKWYGNHVEISHIPCPPDHAVLLAKAD